ncbi:MAG: hypothetical protein KAI71_06185 [Candidatus Pacebacteria bacterium]|nr:hypothetical protein [Candidatus Paceibacterota bacterium]
MKEENFLNHDDIHGEENLIEKLRENPVELIKEGQDIDPEKLKEDYQGEIVVCDAYVDGIEKTNFDPENCTFSDEKILTIDHHSPVEQFEKDISSTNIAIEFVKKNGPTTEGTIVINHTDCDSILSSLIMKGILPPDEKFGEAAISADHTGVENEIADLLQSLQYERDIEFSLKNLQLLLEKKQLEPEAQKLFQKRIDEREKVKETVANKDFKEIDGIIYTEFDEKIDPTLLIYQLPEAKIILSFSPLLKDPDLLEARMRRGMSAPDGLSLNKLDITDFDSNWGGRWNAGSNRRGGGTKLSSEEYIKKLNDILLRF